ncbi:MAG: homocysteine S-methyltransferase family protein [Deltaproteobacteria bacterium]|nr:homocysteine S-methyltransferase family protein [Deltaproteobacteria bacterium]
MTPTELTQRLRDRVLLLDGGLGSYFIAMGLEQGRAPEAWNLEHPEQVIEVHRRYVDAGSDIIQTNSFGASPPKLAASGLEGRCAELNLAAVELARKAAGASALVAGNIGPTGRFLAPMGDATEEQLEEALREQASALARAGVDLISIETMYDLREALAAVRAARDTGLAVLCSMTFELRPRGVFTIMGNRLVPSLQALRDAGATAAGLNCTVTSDAMLTMVEQTREQASLAPVVAQPNAGQPIATPSGIKYDADPDRFAADIGRMLRAGARVVGGCCGTDDAFIRATRRAIDTMVSADG